MIPLKCGFTRNILLNIGKEKAFSMDYSWKTLDLNILINHSLSMNRKQILEPLPVEQSNHFLPILLWFRLRSEERRVGK